MLWVCMHRANFTQWEKLNLLNILTGIDTNTIITSLAKADSGSFEWMGGIASKFLNWGEGNPKKNAGNCGGLKLGFLEVIPCDKPQNFACESKKIE